MDTWPAGWARGWGNSRAVGILGWKQVFKVDFEKIFDFGLDLFLCTFRDDSCILDCIWNRNQIMAAQIENLIANIESKFDHEFNQPDTNSSLQALTGKEKVHEDSENPQSNKPKLNPNPEQVPKSSSQKPTKPSTKQSENGSKPALKPIDPNPSSLDHDQDEVNEKEQNVYKSLSNKLESALKKISTTDKKRKTMSRGSTWNQATLNKNKTMGILHRFSEHERRKEKELEEKRNQEEQKKYFGMKEKPDINPKSRRMAQETSYKPIYERFERILEEKKKKLEQNEQKKKEKQEAQYEAFMTEYQSHVKIHPEQCRDSETYFHDMITWKAKLQKQSQQKLKQKEQKEQQSYTFKPELNQKSMRMVKQSKRVSIQDREIERSFNHVDPQYSFRPKVNKRNAK